MNPSIKEALACADDITPMNPCRHKLCVAVLAAALRQAEAQLAAEAKVAALQEREDINQEALKGAEAEITQITADLARVTGELNEAGDVLSMKYESGTLSAIKRVVQEYSRLNAELAAEREKNAALTDRIKMYEDAINDPPKWGLIYIKRWEAAVAMCVESDNRNEALASREKALADKLTVMTIELGQTRDRSATNWANWRKAVVRVAQMEGVVEAAQSVVSPPCDLAHEMGRLREALSAPKPCQCGSPILRWVHNQPPKECGRVYP